jgi:ATP-GRASP peptide maturase of grasp-with-spasm system
VRNIILIFTEEDDGMAKNVKRQLLNHGERVIQVDEKNPIKFSNFTINNETEKLRLDYKNEVFCSTTIKSIWFRRGYFNRTEPIQGERSIELDFINYNINQEQQSLLDIIYSHFRKTCLTVSDPRSYQVNKIETLRHAKECGLKIPSTLISKSKSDVLEFTLDKAIITKGIQEVFEMNWQSKVYCNQTERVSLNELDSMQDFFFPSLFQDEIIKQFEIRTFYFCGLFYNMAIFSQNDETTQVDFRNYNDEKPNRMLPIQLPSNIEQKLSKLMKKMCLETGSLDLIFSIDGSYTFLEVNPVGQFDFLVNSCNYPITNDIANILKNG